MTLSEFFETSAPNIQTSEMLSSDERDIIGIYRTLCKSDKKLLLAYLQGLAKITP